MGANFQRNREELIKQTVDGEKQKWEQSAQERYDKAKEEWAQSTKEKFHQKIEELKKISTRNCTKSETMGGTHGKMEIRDE